MVAADPFRSLEHSHVGQYTEGEVDRRNEIEE
jgi:hypothetical protein